MSIHTKIFAGGTPEVKFVYSATRSLLSCAVLLYFIEGCWGLMETKVGRVNTIAKDIALQYDLPNSQNAEKKFQFHVAPMQCYTNESMRQLFRFLSEDAILWTEMEKVSDLLGASAAGLERRFGDPGFKDIVLQLGGNDPGDIRNCLNHLTNFGYSFREINLNCGCPSVESGGAATFGASLMKDPGLTRDLLHTISRHKGNEQTQVSLKCRIAVAENEEAMAMQTSSEEVYKNLFHYVSEAEKGGISHLVLHARAAVLSGLSPVKNRQVPPLDYKIVERVARDFPLQITLNGGINSFSQLSALTEPLPDSPISSYMSGRWMLRRPLDLARIQCDHLSESASDPSQQVILAIKKYADFVEQSLQNSKSIRSWDELCLPLYLASEQMQEHSEETYYSEDCCLDSWIRDDDMEQLYAILAETMTWLQELRGTKKKKQLSTDYADWKKLSSAFKGLVGKKVANKWKRNRMEL